MIRESMGGITQMTHRIVSFFKKSAWNNTVWTWTWVTNNDIIGNSHLIMSANSVQSNRCSSLTSNQFPQFIGAGGLVVVHRLVNWYFGHFGADSAKVELVMLVYSWSGMSLTICFTRSYGFCDIKNLCLLLFVWMWHWHTVEIWSHQRLG
jgi:hypothetical protein